MPNQTDTSEVDTVEKLLLEYYRVNGNSLEEDHYGYESQPFKVSKMLIEAIETLILKREREADIRTLETIAALLNGDKNQVDVVKGYVRNKLQMYNEKRRPPTIKHNKEEAHEQPDRQ